MHAEKYKSALPYMKTLDFFAFLRGTKGDSNFLWEKYFNHKLCCYATDKQILRDNNPDEL